VTGATGTTGATGPGNGAIEFVIDGGGSVITSGSKGDLQITFACTITQWTLLADQSGSIVVDVLRSTYAAYPPTSSIATGGVPTLSSAASAQASTSGVWASTAIVAGDILRFSVTGTPTSVTRVTLSLAFTRP
jgi:hypothetical protein